MVLDASLVNIQYRIKGKLSNPEKGEAPYLTPTMVG